ncbi:MAG: cytochrome P450 [Sphingomonadales bacterium]|nr:cytochrome P450 [Sphingomonadales bacterium]
MASIGELASARPEHVPPGLFWDHDFEVFAAQEPDPFRHVCSLHDGPDIFFARSTGRQRPGWILTRQAHIREVFADTEHFSSETAANFLTPIGLDVRMTPLEYDPPRQQLYRKIIEPYFTPAAINALDASVRAACEQLVAGFADADSCEFTSEFTEKFPSYVFLDLMGMPRERLTDFLAWERGMIRPASPEAAVAAMQAVIAYLREFIAQQRTAPTTELMRGITTAQYAGQRLLTDDEILGICFILYIGGLDTVHSTIGWIFWHLAQDPALQQRLRVQPQDIPQAVEELLRAFSAASSVRWVKADHLFHGVRMRAGDAVLLSLPLAGRDPEAYDDPHAVDIDRPVRHIAFGTGPHTCIGLRLAKREIRIVLDVMLSRFADIRLPQGASYEFHASNVFGLDHLPLEWDRI